jgi:hypothetical protein
MLPRPGLVPVEILRSNEATWRRSRQQPAPRTGEFADRVNEGARRETPRRPNETPKRALTSHRIFGLCSFLSTEGRRLNDRTDTEAGKRYSARAEALAAAAGKLPEPGVSQIEIAAAAKERTDTSI